MGGTSGTPGWQTALAASLVHTKGVSMSEISVSMAAKQIWKHLVLLHCRTNARCSWARQTSYSSRTQMMVARVRQMSTEV